MDKKEDFDKQLEDIVAAIEEARRELKALRRHPAELSRGRARPGFITGRERMIEAARAEQRLQTLREQEQELRAKLQSRQQ
ncbi:MAG: hypothetical protein ACLFVD_04705 [Dehalococcoidia bacterium]